MLCMLSLAPVQKTILAARSYPGLAGQPPLEDDTTTASEFIPVAQVQQANATIGSSSSLLATGTVNSIYCS